MSMQRVRMPGAVKGLALAAAVIACNPEGAVQPREEDRPIPQITNLGVSVPYAITPNAFSPLNTGLDAGATYAYVSASPGTVPGVTAAIVNRTRDRQSGRTNRVEALITEGGLDPVPVAASPGDTLIVEFLGADRSLLLTGAAVVPKARPPIIVRTNPRPGKKDVPLNARFEIVFSEPLDPATITADNIVVGAGGVVVAGTLLRTNDFIVEFVPADLLRPETSYQIVVRTGVLSLGGVALESEFSANFETAAAPPVTNPPEPAPPGPGTSSSCAGATQCFAFVRDGAVFTTAFDDSPPVRLLDNATRPAWSRDGSMIAFTRPAGGLITKWSVCVSGSDGTGVRCAVGQEDGYVNGGPSWSPDGSYVAFSFFVYSCPGGNCGQLGGYFAGLWLLDTRTMKVTALSSRLVQSLAWSPDGRKIAFTEWGVGFAGRGGLQIMNADGSNVQFIGSSLGSYSVAGIAWSPDGGKLALSLSDENACPWYCDTALGVVNVDGSGLQVLATASTSFPGRSEDRYISSPAWSADGSRIAYTVMGACYSAADCPTEIRAWDFERLESNVIIPNALGGSWRP